MKDNDKPRLGSLGQECLTPEKKKRELYLRQKALLEQFLKTGAISQAQHDKSLSDLTEKMGYCSDNSTNRA